MKLTLKALKFQFVIFRVELNTKVAEVVQERVLTSLLCKPRLFAACPKAVP